MARAVIWAMGFAGLWGAFFEFTPQEENIRALMRRKLVEGQEILEGIALDDYDKIQTNAKALVEISQAETWQVVQTPEYVKHTSTFRRAVDDIIKHAKEKNGDAVGLDYFRLTRSCVECHKYVRGVRLGRLDSFEDETASLGNRVLSEVTPEMCGQHYEKLNRRPDRELPVPSWW